MTTATAQLDALSPGDPAVLPGAARDRIKRAMDDGRLLPPRRYQADRLASRSRFNLDNWSRQTGKSHVAAQDSVLLGETTGYGVMQLSASLDQTKELMLKAAVFAEVLHGVAGEIQRAVMAGELDEALYVDGSGVRITQTTITLASGERVVGRPANPRTARGFTMHVKLDEFGMHVDPDEIWAAAYPTITSNPKLRLDVMSTPGIRTDDKFAELVHGAERGENDFDYRKVTIFDAVRDGLNADPEQLRRNLGDEDRWRREYLCEFVEEAAAFLTYDLIRGCEHEGISRALPADPGRWDAGTLGWDPDDGALWLGMDVGRRHDLTVLWLLQQVGDVRWTRAVIELRRTPFTEQRQLAEALLSHLPIRRFAIDASGLGMEMHENLERRFGRGRVEGVTFTNKTKAEMAEQLRPQFEDRLIRIPVGQDIRDDLHSVRKTATAAGNVRYDGERTADGHADRFWALALANHAAERPLTPLMTAVL